MKVLSLKLRDEVFEEVEKVVRKIHMPRNAFINEALNFYSKLIERKLKKKEYHRASRIVGAHSLEVLHEFEKLEDKLPE